MMCGHVLSKLDAYIDNELDRRARRAVEEHLAQCAVCREELEALCGLRQLLLESDFPMPQVQPEQFVARVGLQLPRRDLPLVWQPLAHVGWWLWPVSVVGTWVFIDVVLGVSRIMLILLDSGFVPPGLPNFLMGGETRTFMMTGDVGLIMQYLAPQVLAFLGVLFLHFVLVLLYWSWLAGWQIFRRSQRV